MIIPNKIIAFKVFELDLWRGRFADLFVGSSWWFARWARLVRQKFSSICKFVWFPLLVLIKALVSSKILFGHFSWDGSEMCGAIEWGQVWSEFLQGTVVPWPKKTWIWLIIRQTALSMLISTSMTAQFHPLRSSWDFCKSWREQRVW